jgi:hypothetical protein
MKYLTIAILLVGCGGSPSSLFGPSEGADASVDQIEAGAAIETGSTDVSVDEVDAAIDTPISTTDGGIDASIDQYEAAVEDAPAPVQGEPCTSTEDGGSVGFTWYCGLTPCICGCQTGGLCVQPVTGTLICDCFQCGCL